MMNEFYTEIFATRKKDLKGKFDGFDEATAHFSTDAEIGSHDFEKARDEAISERWEQQQQWWLGYRVGATFKQIGTEEVSEFSPMFYEGWRAQEVYEQID